MARTRILYVEQNVDGTVGGSHHYLLALIQGLDPALVECCVAFHEGHSLCDSFRAHCPVFLLHKPKRVARPRHFPLLRRGVNFALMCRDVWSIAMLLRQRRPDLVHLNNSFCQGYDTWGIACRLLGLPLVTFDRCYFQDPLVSRARKYIGVFTKVLCSSDAVRNHYISLRVPPEKLATVYDGVNSEQFRSQIARHPKDVRLEFGLTEDRPLVGMVGNVRHWKGQHVLVGAMARVKQRIPNVHCLIVGAISQHDPSDLEYLRAIERMILEKDLRHNITITGYRDDIPAIVNALDVQVHASITPDPFPRVILEGMCLGMPIIASRSGGAMESVVDHVTGFLCAPGHEEEMANHIIRLLMDGDLRRRMGKAAKERVKEFSMERHINEVIQVYSNALSKNNGV